MRLAAIICVLGSLAVAACGDDDETAPTTTTTGATGATGGAGALEPDQARDLILGQIADAQGLSDKQAGCVADRLSDKLSRQALQEAARTGEPPQELLDAAAAAGVACAKE